MTGASTISSENLGKKSGKIKSCFSCGLTTHLIKDCYYPMLPGIDKETHRSDSAVSVITPENETKLILERITVLQKGIKGETSGSDNGGSYSEWSVFFR